MQRLFTVKTKVHPTDKYNYVFCDANDLVKTQELQYGCIVNDMGLLEILHALEQNSGVTNDGSVVIEEVTGFKELKPDQVSSVRADALNRKHRLNSGDLLAIAAYVKSKT